MKEIREEGSGVKNGEKRNTKKDRIGLETKECCESESIISYTTLIIGSTCLDRTVFSQAIILSRVSESRVGECVIAFSSTEWRTSRIASRIPILWEYGGSEVSR